MKNIIKILKVKLTGDASFIFISNILVKIFGFIIFYFVAKYLSVANYGTLTVLLALITTITDLINSGLSASIIRYIARFKAKKEEDKINKLISTVFFNYIFLGFGIFFITAFFSENISVLILKNNYKDLIIWTSIGILLTFLSGIFTSYFQGVEEYKKYMIQSVITPSIRCMSILILLMIGCLNIKSVVILFNITPLIAVLSGLVLIKNDICISIKNYSLDIIKEISSFGKWMYLWSFVIIIQSRINIYLLSILTTKVQVSYFDVANKFLSLATIVIGVYTVTLNPKFSKLLTKKDIEKEIKKVKKVMVYFTFYLCGCIILVPFGIKIIFGEKYLESIIPLITLLVFQIPFIWNTPYNVSLFAMGKSKVFFIDSVVTLTVTLCLSYLLLPKYGALGAVFSQGTATLISLVISRVGYYFYIKENKRNLTYR